MQQQQLDLVMYHIGQALVHLYGAMTESEGEDDTSRDVWSQLDDVVTALTELREDLSTE